MTSPGRRIAFGAALLGWALLAAPAAASGGKLPLDAPIPDTVPPGTELVVGGTTIDLALTLSGERAKLPFALRVVNITGGPDTIAAFNGNALDVGASADIPPIEAHFIGMAAKIVAVRFRREHAVPTYQFGIAPKGQIATLADLRGKRIAFSPGQAQGSVVLRTLKQFGVAQGDVQLIELPATGTTYFNALAANLVDAAPLAGIQIKRYVDQYGPDGAKIIANPGVKENPTNLWVRVETLEDPAKAAAVKLYLEAWARALRWTDTHHQEWLTAYYVKDQGVPPDDVPFIDQAIGLSDIPSNWRDAIVSEQETIDFMAAETGHDSVEAASLFDRRFEKIAGDAYEAGE
jgi:sulfonate transport system substrate-binding protein